MPAEGPLVHDHEEKTSNTFRILRDHARRAAPLAWPAPVPATMITDYEKRTGGETRAG